jgi:hypothetical protein
MRYSSIAHIGYCHRAKHFRASLLFEKNFKGEVDEGIERLITLFRLRPDQCALPAIEQEGG